MSRELQHVLDAFLDGLVVLDANGCVERLNSEACRILETSGEAVARQPVERLLGDEHALARLVRGVLDSGRPSVESDERVEHRRREPLLVDITGSALFDERGQIDGVVVVLRDRTIRRSLQEAVAERERLDLFGRVAAGIAHEVKNPLAGIRGAGEILSARAADGKTREAADLIVREVGRISALLENFMVLARGDELRVEPVNLHRVLDEVIQLLRCDPVGADVEFVRLFDPSIPELEADRDRLSQVFLNLARNALEAMGSTGGRLTISTRMVFDHHFSAESSRSGPTVAIAFQDTGPGIPDDVIEKIATPFFTTRAGGTGLGLPIAEHWVTRHGGRLRIKSEPGEGAHITVLLPLRRPT